MVAALVAPVVVEALAALAEKVDLVVRVAVVPVSPVAKVSAPPAVVAVMVSVLPVVKASGPTCRVKMSRPVKVATRKAAQIARASVVPKAMARRRPR